ncbi:MAG TPA: SIS domain-containing protein [Mycobacteriales bacterium]|nr:SIS domain-containing protein [Mycobacteriales bacterium]
MQPEVFDRLLRSGAPDVAKVAGQVARRRPRFVLLAGRGTSDHAAVYAKYLVEVRLGLPAGLVSPSTMTVYGARPDLRDVLFCAVSQSGGSPDLVDSLAAARSAGALTLAVTNNPSSPLAGQAELHVDVRAGTERAVAATKTYTAELLALYLLVEGIRGGDPAGSAAALPRLAADALDRDETVARIAARYRFADRLVTTARGYSYPTAREAALKLMETSYLSAQAFSGADLLHGPMAMVDQVMPVVAIVSGGAGGAAMAPVVWRLRERGADLVVVGGSASSVEADVVLPPVDEVLAPLLEILPLQRLAWHVAVGRGVDPDHPRGLTKITETW